MKRLDPALASLQLGGKGAVWTGEQVAELRRLGFGPGPEQRGKGWWQKQAEGNPTLQCRLPGVRI